MKRKTQPSLLNLDIKGPDNGLMTIILSGRLSLAEAGSLAKSLQKATSCQGLNEVVLDLSGLDYLDMGGALALYEAAEEMARRNIASRQEGISPEFKQIQSLISKKDLETNPIRPPEKGQGLIAGLGEGAINLMDDCRQAVSFIGEVFVASMKIIRNPAALRWGDVVLYMERAGVDGLPIVALVSYLLGLILAYMSSIQLAPFGANIYVANLVGVAMVSELGPIMTAILVAGRSGSAFAAEIGTMKVNEEVDALKVMGYEPVLFLAMPKIVAAMMVVPLLTFFSMAMGIMGGLTVAVLGMDITATGYIKQTVASLTLMGFFNGMWKSAVFAILIAGIGCQRGFMVKGGAESVGQVTTSAVVAALFIIIVADSIFALILYT